MVCTDGISVFTYMCILLASYRSVCYWLNVCIDLCSSAWLSYRYRCTDVHVCMSLYHFILLNVMQDLASVYFYLMILHPWLSTLGTDLSLCLHLTVYICLLSTSVYATITCWSTHLMWCQIGINMPLHECLCVLVITTSVWLDDSSPGSCNNYSFPVFSFANAFVFITCYILTMSPYVNVFCVCICDELSCKWCVSGIVFAYTIFHFHFCLLAWLPSLKYMNWSISSFSLSAAIVLLASVSSFWTVIFCRYFGGLFVSLRSCDYASCVWSLWFWMSKIKVICSMSYYYPVYPWFMIFPLHCYSWTCR